MSSKDILNRHAKEILTKIVAGEELQKLQEEYGVDQGDITDYYRKLFENDRNNLRRFNFVVQYGQQKTATKEIDQSEFEYCVEEYLAKNMTLREAGQRLGISYQFFREKMKEYFEEHEDLREIYEYAILNRTNYRKIDFRKYMVEMLKNRFSQEQIETKYGFRPKTMDRKIVALLYRGNRRLYKAYKIWVEALAQKRELNEEETDCIDKTVHLYEIRFKIEEEEAEDC